MAEGVSIEFAGNLLKVFQGDAAAALGTLDGTDTSYYIGLGSANPPVTGSFTGIEFLTANGYTRYEVTNIMAPGLWAINDREMVNTQTIVFGPATTAAWPEVRSVGIFKNNVDTTALIFGHLLTGYATPLGNYLKFNPGSLVIKLVKDVNYKSVILAQLQLGLARGQSYSFPGNDVYIALGSRLKGDGTIEEFQSTTSGLITYAGGYERAVITLDGATFTDPTGVRQTANTVMAEFEDATAHWPTAKAFALYTAQTGGDPWYAGMLPSDALVREGDNVIVLTDKLIIKE